MEIILVILLAFGALGQGCDIAKHGPLLSGDDVQCVHEICMNQTTAVIIEGKCAIEVNQEPLPNQDRNCDFILLDKGDRLKIPPQRKECIQVTLKMIDKVVKINETAESKAMTNQVKTFASVFKEPKTYKMMIKANVQDFKGVIKITEGTDMKLSSFDSSFPKASAFNHTIFSSTKFIIIEIQSIETTNIIYTITIEEKEPMKAATMIFSISITGFFSSLIIALVAIIAFKKSSSCHNDSNPFPEEDGSSNPLRDVDDVDGKEVPEHSEKKSENVIIISRVLNCIIPALACVIFSLMISSNGRFDHNKEACHLNFLCDSRGIIGDFGLNRLISNLTFFIGGVALIINGRFKEDYDLCVNGFNLIVQGVASILYHKCPNSTVKAIDTLPMQSLALTMMIFGIKKFKGCEKALRVILVIAQFIFTLISALLAFYGRGGLAMLAGVLFLISLLFSVIDCCKNCNIFKKCNFKFLMLVIVMIISFAIAASCYTSKSVDTSLPLIESQIFNQECISGTIFDLHDIWHFSIGISVVSLILLLHQCSQ